MSQRSHGAPVFSLSNLIACANYAYEVIGRPAGARIAINDACNVDLEVGHEIRSIDPNLPVVYVNIILPCDGGLLRQVGLLSTFESQVEIDGSVVPWAHLSDKIPRASLLAKIFSWETLATLVKGVAELRVCQHVRGNDEYREMVQRYSGCEGHPLLRRMKLTTWRGENEHVSIMYVPPSAAAEEKRVVECSMVLPPPHPRKQKSGPPRSQCNGCRKLTQRLGKFKRRKQKSRKRGRKDYLTLEDGKRRDLRSSRCIRRQRDYYKVRNCS